MRTFWKSYSALNLFKREVQGKNSSLSKNMKAYKGSTGKSPLIYNLGTRRKRVVNFTTWPLFIQGKNPVPTGQEAGWALKPVRTFRREKYLLLLLGFELLIVHSVPW